MSISNIKIFSLVKKHYHHCLLIYFSMLLILLLTRTEYTLLPIWFLTISQKKLIVIMTASALLTIPAFFICHSRPVLTILLLCNLAIPIISYNDSYILRNGHSFEQRGISLIAQNNPYLNNIGEIRELKLKSSSSTQLWKTLSNRFLFNSRSAENLSKDFFATNAMLIVAAFYDYGNNIPNQKASGCVGNSEETHFVSRPKSFSLLATSRIGCCTDFAYMLGSFLTYLKIKNELVFIQGHTANRAYYDGQWYYLDSNSALHIEGMYDDSKHKPRVITYYPHPNLSTISQRYDIYNFTNQLITSFSDQLHFVNQSMTTQPIDTAFDSTPGLIPSK